MMPPEFQHYWQTPGNLPDRLKHCTVNPDSKTDTVYYFEISGKVMDTEERQPLPFSSIYLVGKAIGTISNEEGEFLLKFSSV